MTGADKEDRPGPWPGPVPYGEQHRHVFRGRDLELREVRQRLRKERLVLITAFSGVGKTSFLLAGVVPELRLRRHAALTENKPALQPAVLVIRDWVGARSADPDEFFVRALESSVQAGEAVSQAYCGQDDLQRSIERDYDSMVRVCRRLSRAKDRTRAFDYVARLTDTLGGLVLILDQFEETLQGSAALSGGMWEIVASLHYQNSAVKQLLSFRQEFLSCLRPLEFQIGPLGARTYYLQEIPQPRLHEAIIQSGEQGGVQVEDEAIAKLMSWMREAGASGDPDLTSRAEPDWEAPGPDECSERADLLKLQALLLELYTVAKKGAGDSSVVISARLLDELIQEERRRDASVQLSGPGLVRTALRRFIDRRVLPVPDTVESPAGLPPEVGKDDQRVLQRRRVAARMAPHFSTGSLKVPMYVESLLGRAWEDEWQILLNTTAQDIERILAGKDLGHAVRRLDERLGLSDLRIDRGAGILSGTARDEAWSTRQSVVALVEITREALDALARGNVVRPKRAPDGTVYELVHDGFGPAFVQWAADERRYPLDALAAITAQRGITFGWAHVAGVVREACWRGCWLGPSTETGELALDNVSFVSCDLRGTLFDRCVFRGGAFRDCDLDGVIFRNCAFEPGDSGPFVFQDVRASALAFFGGSAAKVRFQGSLLFKMSWGIDSMKHELSDVVLEDCILNQLTVGGIRISGTIQFRRSWLVLSDLARLSPTEGRIRLSECKLAFCRLAETLEASIRKDATNEFDPTEWGVVADMENPWG